MNLKLIVNKLKEEEVVMGNCISVRRKEVKSGRILWKGS